MIFISSVGQLNEFKIVSDVRRKLYLWLIVFNGYRVIIYLEQMCVTLFYSVNFVKILCLTLRQTYKDHKFYSEMIKENCLSRLPIYYINF